MSNTILSRRLKNLREKHGYLQKFVADKLGVRSNTLSGYENGSRSPDPEMLVKLAELYDVTTDYLLGKSDSPNLNQDEETEKILNDPQTNIMFKDWEKMNDEQREEALNIIRYIISKDKK